MKLQFPEGTTDYIDRFGTLRQADADGQITITDYVLIHDMISAGFVPVEPVEDAVEAEFADLGFIDTDGTLAGNSDSKVPSQKATKTYADTKVAKSLFAANSILAATADNTPAALTVTEQTVVGRITAGAIAALSVAEVLTLIGVESGADVTDATNVAAAGAVMDSDITPGEGILRKTGTGAYTAHKTNLAASAGPSVNDDGVAGYSVGSLWIDTTGDVAYVCVDSSTGAAVWLQVMTAAQVSKLSGIEASADVTDATNVAAAGAAMTYLLQLVVADSDGSVSAADGKKGFAVPAALNGWNISDVTAAVAEKGITGSLDVQIRRVRQAAALGDATTQFDITNPAATTFRYTYDATGTDPVIADSNASLRIGDHIDVQAQNFNAGNKGHFVLTGVGANYFEVDNAGGAVESDKTIGTGSIVPIKHRDVLSTKVTVGDEYFASDEVIDTALDDVATGDLIYVDVDAVHSGTAPKGLCVTIVLSK